MRISDWSSDVCSSDLGATSLLRNPDDPTSESEAGSKPAPDASLRNPKQARTVRSTRINEVRTTAHAQAQARALGDLQWPKRFAELKAEQIGRASCRERVCK